MSTPFGSIILVVPNAFRVTEKGSIYANFINSEIWVRMGFFFFLN